MIVSCPSLRFTLEQEFKPPEKIASGNKTQINLKAPVSMISSPENHFRVVPAAIRDCHRQQDTDSEKVRTIGECPTCFAVEANTWDYPTSIHHLYCQFPVRYVWSGLDPALPGTKHDNRSTPIPSDKHPELLKTEQRGTENRQSNRSIPARSSDRSYSTGGIHLSACAANFKPVSHRNGN